MLRRDLCLQELLPMRQAILACQTPVKILQEGKLAYAANLGLFTLVNLPIDHRANCCTCVDERSRITLDCGFTAFCFNPRYSLSICFGLRLDNRLAFVIVRPVHVR